MMNVLGSATPPGDWFDQASLVTLIVRTIVGLTLAAHGYKKIFLGGKLAGTARWFESIGMKPNGKIHAYLASATELGCGIMMILGLLTPFAAAGYVGLMIVAAWVDHRPNGYWSNNGWEYVSVLGTFAAFIAGMGPGKHSLDWALGFDFAFAPLTGFAIAVGLGALAGIGLIVTCYRPPAPSNGDA
ncbi:MAG: DoxX family protein [Acidimicrobiales bacterium]|nr:DoxX family protein [Acidimicrobiales bacterium]